jgi:hypothetical protein
MTSARYVLLGILLMGSAALASADGLADPRMIVSDPPCDVECPNPVGLTFSFFSNANGGGFLTFTNASGFDWTSLLIETGSIPFNVPPNLISCQTNAFLSCEVSDLGGGITAMYLSGVNGPDSDGPFGIPAFDIFTINLNGEADDPVDESQDGSGGWGPGRNFDASANVPPPVPEPATITLIAAGLGVFLAKKKLGSRRDSNS